MSIKLKAFKIHCCDFPESVIVAAQSHAKGKALVACSLMDSWGYDFFEAIKSLTCVRAKEFDGWALLKESPQIVSEHYLRRYGDK